MQIYHGTGEIARWLRVSRESIRCWLNTFEGTEYACPAPEVLIGKVQGWSDAALIEWGAWYRRYRTSRRQLNKIVRKGR